LRLKGKVAIITGASRGIGAKIAKMFVNEGAKVVLAARSIDDMKKIKKDIGSDSENSILIKVDVRNKENIKLMADKTYNVFGRIDVLVNNAGYPVFRYPIDDIDERAEERYETIMETNLRGYWYSARFVIPYMKKRKKGSIINISSVRGYAGLANETAYCAAKGGVNMFTRALAIEIAPFNIRVNTISPGAIQVGLGHWVLARYGEKAHKIYVKKYKDVHELGMKLNQPLRTIGRPKDIGYAAIYFASEESRFTTGSNLFVDGGLTSLLAEPSAMDIESIVRLYNKSKEMNEWFSTMK